MAHAPLLTDDLLRHLMAVGQVDIVVGLPTLNNAETIAGTVRAADEGLTKYFPRDRTVIISADGGSGDGTSEIVREQSSGGTQGRGVGGLRTRHRISASYRGVPSQSSAVRLIFAAAELLQARAVAVLDPQVASLTPGWVFALVNPVLKQSFDFVAPVYERHPLEGPLLAQLLRPLLRATYGRGIQEPLIGEFGCSGGFATYCLAQDVWDSGLAQNGVEVWLTGTALTGDFRPCQAFLGPRTLTAAQGPRPSLREVFPTVVGSLFESLDKHARHWLAREGSEPLPTIGPQEPLSVESPSLNPTRLGESFCRDVRDLRPILESILAADTFAKLWTLTESGCEDAPAYPDPLWIATVYDFLAAYHVGVMDRTHIAQALMPLYLGRVASFMTQHVASGPSEVGQDLERLAQQFEQAKPYLIERWNRTT